MTSTTGTLRREAGVELAYTVDDFHDPWTPAETIVLVHGLAESAVAWDGWVPHLARRYRVVRPDLRGFGRSTPMARDFAWSLDGLADDLAAVIEALGCKPAHIVGAKIGSTISARCAARHPGLLRTLTLIGLPVKGSRNRPGLDPETHGVRAWARSSMEDRLGPVPSEMLEWWSDLMGATALSTLLGFSHAVGDFNVIDDLPRIACPTLLLTTDSKLHPASDSDKWRAMIPDARTIVIPGEGYHAAAVFPDACAKAVCEFMAGHPMRR
jgi:pimeloyl-ACP methyl ester carboxylesterase